MEESHDPSLFDRDDDGLVRVQAATLTLGKEAIEDDAVVTAHGHVAAVLAERAPGAPRRLRNQRAEIEDAVRPSMRAAQQT
jgi:hypothetical protein